MASTPQYAGLPRIGIATLSTGNASRENPTTAQTVLTAGASGTRIDRISLDATGTTTASTIRFFVNDGTTNILWQEISVTAATPSSTVLGYAATLSSQVNISTMPLILPTGHSLRATVHDTQITQRAQVNSLVASGTLSGTLTLGNGVFITTVASTAAVAALQTLGGAGFVTLTASTYTAPTPSVISLTSTGNISGVTFTVRGTDSNGAIITENIVGPNNSTVFGTLAFSTVTSIFASAAVGTNTSVGIASSVTLPVTAAQVTISSAANVTGVNFTIRGVNDAGAQITETIAGPNAGGTVTSANAYRSVTLITTSASAATTSIGTAQIPTLIRVVAQGGDF